MTKNQVDAENYPFCTIEPNVGTVPVPDDRLYKLASIYKSESVIPTVIEFVDIAGLVAGAHKGEGLGNKFLSHIREVDAICQVVRDFEDGDVTHVSGEVNPESDKQVINTELILADLETVEKRISDIAGGAKTGDKELKKELIVCKKVEEILNNGNIIFEAGLSPEEQELISDLHFLTNKPMLYVLNVDEENASKKQENYVVISAKIESELAEMKNEEAVEYLKSLGLDQTGLNRLIIAAYKALNLITFFTAGPEETRAWTVEEGSSAPVAGSRIHTDFEEKFIRAEITFWKDIIEYEGEINAKSQGKVRTEGKEYIVKDGDVIYFRI